MTGTPLNEKDCQQDTLQRVHSWLGLLDTRINSMLELNDPQLMKPNEREQAISRYMVLQLRLLQLRQQYVEASPSAGEQALLDALLQGLEDE